MTNMVVQKLGYISIILVNTSVLYKLELAPINCNYHKKNILAI